MHMLNPRDFLEDAMLSGFQSFWSTGMPWALVNKAIDTKFAYNVSDDCKTAWVAQTGRAWENAEDGMMKALKCPACGVAVEIPWTTCGLPEDYTGDDRPGLVGNGYGDGNLLHMCPSAACGVVIDKHLLAVSKFCKDTEGLLARGRRCPAPSWTRRRACRRWCPPPTLLRRMFPRTFPNRMLQHVLRIQVVELIKPGMRPNPSMNDVRSLIERVVGDQDKLKAIDGLAGIRRHTLNQTARISIRKMMSHYWENFSPFSLDLCGAVMRQGIFCEKMVKIDWLHSPSAPQTMGRLLTKYQRFTDIMAAHPTKVAVPTLDVDLAWHTHQLSPFAYYSYTVGKSRRFVDHDDKIDEDKLSSSFQWTSKTYQEKYNEVYSECTCWYCEGECLVAHPSANPCEMQDPHSLTRSACSLQPSAPRMSRRSARSSECLSKTKVCHNSCISSVRLYS